MKPSERIAEIARARMVSLVGAGWADWWAHANGAHVAAEDVVAYLDEHGELETRRFAFLLFALESGEWQGLTAKAREEGLL